MKSGAHLPWLKLILDAVLIALALDLEGGEDKAVPHKVGSVAHAFAGLEAASKSKYINHIS